ncbi:hypothetical protein WJ86_00895 [Burkholderia multivorans]|uniref:hypothetical protein n=1 Tax=Burkholderia multivorans TaxID=87883 RepID=UPI000757BE1C|nr:hypothetical protein [Burkholderia multivorans]KVP18508.1 hypothetical protein WJ86_00895 [Burkholderia multivorans]MBJ9942424.1 hypothetical protein [Burkholderia multivorans]MBU9284306.1 hypothetical protein [Burkholderia multivorans]
MRVDLDDVIVRFGVGMVGISTALAIDSNLPRDWRPDKDNAPQLSPIAWKYKTLAPLANMAAVKFQLRRLSRGKTPEPHVSPLRARRPAASPTHAVRASIGAA